MDIMFDAWTCFVEENNVPPTNAFELINFSRTTDKIPTLSYNKALIIYEKHSKKNKKLKKKKKRKISNRMNKSSKSAANSISMSVTSPILSPNDEPSVAVITNNNSKQRKQSHADDDAEYNINDRVLLNKDREGIIKYIGGVHFTNGTVYGIELQNGSIGKHDGTIDEKRYFKTDAKRGVFVKEKQIRRKMRSKDFRTSLRLRREDSIETKARNSIIKIVDIDNIKTVHEAILDEDYKETDTKRRRHVIPPKRKRRKGRASAPPALRRRSSSVKKPKTLKRKPSKKKLKKKGTMSIDDAHIFRKMTQNLVNEMDDNSDWDDIEDDVKYRKKHSVDDMIIDNYFENQQLNRVHSRIPQRKRKYTTDRDFPSSFKQYKDSRFDSISSLKRMKTKETVRRRSSLDLEPKSIQKHSRGTQSVLGINGMNQKLNTKKHSRFHTVTSAFNKISFNRNKNKNKSKNKRNTEIKTKNLCFAIDPLQLESTMIESRDYECKIPNILIALQDALFANNGHLKEGIFRIAPNARRCKEIVSELNNGESVDFDQVDGGLVANLIKIWFRQLPNPVLQSIDSTKIEKVQQTQNMDSVENIIQNDLTQPNKSYFQWLLDVCVDITKYEEENKMTTKNMAVVLSPNLFDVTKIQNPMKIMTLSAAMVTFLQLAIQCRRNSTK